MTKIAKTKDMSPQEAMSELCAASKIFSSAILSSNFCQNGNAVTWGGYASGIHADEINYLSDYRRIIDGKQYSFLLMGGDAVQVYYAWDSDGVIISSRLAIYPSPLDGFHTEYMDWEISATDLFDEMVEKPIRPNNWTHLRFDLDHTAQGHDPLHIQHSAVNEFRIPSAVLMTPFYFISLAVKYSAPEEFKKISNKESFKAALSIAKKKLMWRGVEDYSLPHLTAAR